MRDLLDKHFGAFTHDYLQNHPRRIANFTRLDSLLPFLEIKTKNSTYSRHVDGEHFYGDTPKYVITKTPHECLIYHLNKAKNRAKFWKLFHGVFIHEGEWLSTENYPTQSEGDLALVSLAMYYAKSENFLSRYYQDFDGYNLRGLAYSHCDMLLKKSGLFRKKWRRRDYRISTLHLAYECRTETYNPNDYFDKHCREEFSELQRYRQGLSAYKRSKNCRQKVLDAYSKLNEKGEKITNSKLARISGVGRKFVVNLMKEVD